VSRLHRLSREPEIPIALDSQPLARLPATSRPGAFWTPAVRACGEFGAAGIQKPAQKQSFPGGLILAAGRRLSWIDTANALFHRHADGDAETTKRQPALRLSPRLLAHLRRWERLDGA
jgi:hypothetical protein